MAMTYDSKAILYFLEMSANVINKFLI